MFAQLNKINKERQNGTDVPLHSPPEIEPKRDQIRTKPTPKTPRSPTPRKQSQYSPTPSREKVAQTIERSAEPAVAPAPSPHTREHSSIVQSTDQSIDRTPVMGKPRGFYITEKQHADIDTAVENLAHLARNKVDQKIDRSTVLRLLLEEVDITSPDVTEKLYNRLVNRLVSRLNS